MFCFCFPFSFQDFPLFIIFLLKHFHFFLFPNIFKVSWKFMCGKNRFKYQKKNHLKFSRKCSWWKKKSRRKFIIFFAVINLIWCIILDSSSSSSKRDYIKQPIYNIRQTGSVVSGAPHLNSKQREALLKAKKFAIEVSVSIARMKQKVDKMQIVPSQSTTQQRQQALALMCR